MYSTIILNPSLTPVIGQYYHCNALAEHCGSCSEIKANYNCGWCENTSLKLI